LYRLPIAGLFITIQTLKGAPLKTSKRSLFAFGSIAAASALVLSGCAASETPAPTPTATSDAPAASPSIGTLVVWADDMVAKSLEGVAAQFEADTGITVEIIIKEFGSIRDEAITAIPTGEGPDILAGAHDWTGQLVAAGVIAPVELGAALGNFRENAVSAFSYDGALYGLPFGVENIALVCNSALMPAQPSTWEEVVAAGVEIAMGADSGDPYHMYYIQTSFGAPVFDQNPDGSYASTLGMGTDGGFAFADWLAANGSTFGFKDYGTVEAEMKSGELACWITGPWAAPGIAEALGDDGYEIYSLPSVGGQPASQFLGARGFYVSAQTKDPLFVNKFLSEYIASEAAQTEIFEIGGRIPAHKASLAAAADNKIVAGFGAAGVNAAPMPSIPEMGSVWASWGSTQAAIMQGKIGAREGWQKMIDEINAAIAG
jgi:arabinogalactan oligomer / maltooligosaccharide transport system substrate-binding protein